MAISMSFEKKITTALQITVANVIVKVSHVTVWQFADIDHHWSICGPQCSQYCWRQSRSFDTAAYCFKNASASVL